MEWEKKLAELSFNVCLFWAQFDQFAAQIEPNLLLNSPLNSPLNSLLNSPLNSLLNSLINSLINLKIVHMLNVSTVADCVSIPQAYMVCTSGRTLNVNHKKLLQNITRMLYHVRLKLAAKDIAEIRLPILN